LAGIGSAGRTWVQCVFRTLQSDVSIGSLRSAFWKVSHVRGNLTVAHAVVDDTADGH
jgi:hypothetical protein